MLNKFLVNNVYADQYCTSEEEYLDAFIFNKRSSRRSDIYHSQRATDRIYHHIANNNKIDNLNIAGRMSELVTWDPIIQQMKKFDLRFKLDNVDVNYFYFRYRLLSLPNLSELLALGLPTFIPRRQLLV